jgi:excisionase family DNA binding protein
MASAIPNLPVFTTGQIAKLCCVAPRTVKKWIDRGILQGYKVPGSKDRRVSRETLVAFMEQHGIPLGATTDRIVLVSADSELATALSGLSVEVSVVGNFFDLGEQLRASAPHAIIVDLAHGETEAEEALARCAIRFPSVKRFAVCDNAKRCEKALETFSRPFDPALVAERIITRVHPAMGIVGDPFEATFRRRSGQRRELPPGRGNALQADPVPGLDPNDKTTLLGFFENVYRVHRLIDGSTHQINKYRYTIRVLSELLGHPAMLDDLTDDNVARFMQHLASKGKKPGTVNHSRTHLLALANHAIRRGMIRQVFEVRPVRDYQQSPKAWTREQLAKLMDTIGKLKGDCQGIPANLWWESLHRCLWDSGLRIGALLQLKWSDIDLDRGVMCVRAETQKDREEQQHVLKPTTVAVLLKMQQPVRELVFGMPITYPSLFYKYKAILKLAGLPHDRRSMFHRMRKTVASYYEREGGNATSLLGHSNRKTTMKYIDPTISSPKPAAAVLFELEPTLAIGGQQ